MCIRDSIQAAQDAKISAERLNEIHDMEDEEPEDKEKIREIPADADLELKNVTFQYEGPHSAKVLDDVSLKIPAGKVTAIVGVSGCLLYTSILFRLDIFGISKRKTQRLSWITICLFPTLKSNRINCLSLIHI